MEKDKKDELPQLQWFPGHMKKAERLIRENLKLVDVAVELLDARIPAGSQNPLLSEIIGDKPRLVVLNKSDLADPKVTKEWLAYFKAQGAAAVAVDATKGSGLKELTRRIEELARPKTEKLVRSGARARAARCMILGIPNVGKSSLINRLAGSARTKTENRPGVTRAKQWIKIGRSLELLDMPGVLWPKFEDPQVGLHLAFTGAINDDIYDREEVAALLLTTLRRDYGASLAARFSLNLDDFSTGVELLEAIGRKRGALIKGGMVDMEKATVAVLAEFRAGKLGRVTLERPKQGGEEDA